MFTEQFATAIATASLHNYHWANSALSSRLPSGADAHSASSSPASAERSTRDLVRGRQACVRLWRLCGGPQEFQQGAALRRR
jgi:hypothetical protein